MENIQSICKVPKDWDRNTSTFNHKFVEFDLSLASKTSLFRLSFKGRTIDFRCDHCKEEIENEILPQESADAKLLSQFRKKNNREISKSLDNRKKKVKKLADLSKISREKIFAKLTELAEIECIKVKPCCEFFPDSRGFFGDDRTCFAYSAAAPSYKKAKTDKETKIEGLLPTPPVPEKDDNHLNCEKCFDDCSCKLKSKDVDCKNKKSGSLSGNDIARLINQSTSRGINHFAVDFDTRQCVGYKNFARLFINKLCDLDKNSPLFTMSLPIEEEGEEPYLHTIVGQAFLKEKTAFIIDPMLSRFTSTQKNRATATG